MSKPFRFSIIFLALLVAGCYPLSSKYPLGSRATGEELVGVWRGEDIELKVVQSGRNLLTFKFTALDGDLEDEPNVLFYTALPSLIENERFLSVKQTFPREFLKEYAKVNDISLSKARRKFQKRDKRMNGYYLGYYDIVNTDGRDHLTIYLMDDDNEIVEAALEDGTLRGREIQAKDEDGEENEILYVTSSSRKLTQFVADHAGVPKNLFDLEVVEMIGVE